MSKLFLALYAMEWLSQLQERVRDPVPLCELSHWDASLMSWRTPPSFMCSIWHLLSLARDETPQQRLRWPPFLDSLIGMRA